MASSWLADCISRHFPAGAAPDPVPLREALDRLLTDPRGRRGKRHSLSSLVSVLVTGVASAYCGPLAVAQAAAGWDQDVLTGHGCRVSPRTGLRVPPSASMLDRLPKLLDADELEAALSACVASAGRLEGLLTAIAIDGKWLRGVADGQVKLFAAMLHQEKVIIAQHRIPDDTNEITQVEELLDPVDLTDAVVTADAAHAQHDTAEYSAGKGKRTTC